MTAGGHLWPAKGQVPCSQGLLLPAHGRQSMTNVNRMLASWEADMMVRHCPRPEHPDSQGKGSAKKSEENPLN